MADTPPLLASLRSRSRWMRWLRLVVALLAIGAMTPGSLEVVETLGHWLHDGHAPHGEVHDGAVASGDERCADDCGEHGCTAVQHVCKCCGSVAAAAEEPPSLESRSATLALEVRPSDRFDGAERAVPPPVPPPIA